VERNRALRTLIAGSTLAAAVAVPFALAPSASAVTGLVVITARGPDTGSEGFKWAEATCPAGTHVLGGGADITGGANGVHLSSMLPIPGAPDTFFASAMEDSRGYGGSWTLTAFAVCGAGVTGWEVVQSDVPAEPGSTYTAAVATCPAGKKVVGVGGAVSGGSRYILDSVDPGEDLSDAFVEAIGDETTPVDGAAWGAHAYAICADPVAGQRLVTATSGFSRSNKTASVTCPRGTTVHGVGGGLRGAFGQAHIDRLATSGGPRPAGVDIDARQDTTGASGEWRAYVYAICAT
jgi:hypothetical protein